MSSSGDPAGQADALAQSSRDLLPTLDTRERRVLDLRFGLIDGRCRTLQEIGDDLGMTRERVRQIEHKVLKQMREQNIKLRTFASAIIAGDATTLRPSEAHHRLLEVLAAWPESAAHPAGWMQLLAKCFPEFGELLAPDRALAKSRRVFQRLLRASSNTVVWRDDFLDAYEDEAGSRAAAVAEWRELATIMPKLHWKENVAITNTYQAMARYVMLVDEREMHWQEIFTKIDEAFPSRSVVPSSLYNAIISSDFFVYRGPGTYGLREHGLERTPFQRVTIARYLEREGRTRHRYEIEAGVAALGHPIPSASVMWHLLDHPQFYEDVDGKYGLREWLSAPDDQTLRTPRWLQESPKSSKRRGPRSGRLQT